MSRETTQANHKDVLAPLSSAWFNGVLESFRVLGSLYVSAIEFTAGSAPSSASDLLGDLG